MKIVDFNSLKMIHCAMHIVTKVKNKQTKQKQKTPELNVFLDTAANSILFKCPARPPPHPDYTLEFPA